MRPIDKRRTLLPAAVTVAALAGYLLDVAGRAGPRPADAPAAAYAARGDSLPAGADARLAHASFQRAVVALREGQPAAAQGALHTVLTIYPRLPEAHGNLGFALLGLERYGEAAAAFRHAADLRPSLHTAYYGLALAEHGRGDLPAAVAAMQAFAHLAAADDPWLSRALAALREWEYALASASRAPGASAGSAGR